MIGTQATEIDALLYNLNRSPPTELPKRNNFKVTRNRFRWKKSQWQDFYGCLESQRIWKSCMYSLCFAEYLTILAYKLFVPKWKDPEWSRKVLDEVDSVVNLTTRLRRWLKYLAYATFEFISNSMPRNSGNCFKLWNYFNVESGFILIDRGKYPQIDAFHISQRSWNLCWICSLEPRKHLHRNLIPQSKVWELFVTIMWNVKLAPEAERI